MSEEQEKEYTCEGSGFVSKRVLQHFAQEAEYENYSGYDPEDPPPDPASPWESFAEK
jgi:hypothetical protein